MGSSTSALARAERALLTRGLEWWTQHGQPAEPQRAPPVEFTLSDVAVGDGLHIHTAAYRKTEAAHRRTPPAKPSEQTPLVAMHGFGTGLGIYYAALPALAEKWAGPVFALDSLGCCLSSRPRWHLEKGEACAVAKAESFFVDGLERWRAQMKIDKMVLMGHSLGGYLAVAYAEKYPQHVDRLVLVSAVGVPLPPEELAEAHAQAPWLVRTVLSAWKNGFSPFSVAKLGLGSFIMRRYVERRFSDAPWVAKPELKEYFHGSWTGGSNSAGGYAHATLLRPGGRGELAYAREPLGPERIPGLQVSRVSALYGDRDWMDWRNMAAVREDVLARGCGPDIEILYVAGASHNMQVDNPLGFVDAVLATCNGGKGAHRQTYGSKYFA